MSKLKTQDEPDLVNRLQKFTLPQLQETYPDDDLPLIHGLVRLGETMNVVASPKIGKTWLVAGLALSIANGLDWLGMPTLQGRVLVFDCELRPPTLRNRYERVAQAMGVSGDNLDIVPLRGQQRSVKEFVTLIGEIATEGQYAAIVWDALYRLLGRASENSNEDMAGVYNALDAIASQTGATNIVVHHSTKGDQSYKAQTDVGSGAGSISRACDTHLTVRPHELAGCAVLEGVCRSFKSPAAQTIRFDFPVWESTAIEPEVKRPPDPRQRKQDSNDGETRTALLEALKCGRWLTLWDLRLATTFGPERVKRGLTLVKDSVQSRSAKSKKTGRRQEVFKLKPPQERPPQNGNLWTP